jgi:hypothetical protein
LNPEVLRFQELGPRDEGDQGGAQDLDLIGHESGVGGVEGHEEFKS